MLHSEAGLDSIRPESFLFASIGLLAALETIEP